jgi:Putative inner membrane protein (DUF1819)
VFELRLLAEGSGLHKRNVEICEGNRYNTRIQKGGALLEEMRQLVRVWQETPVSQQKLETVRANVLNKSTRTRSADTFAYIAFCIQKLGSYGSQITFHSDWRLFLLSVREVEHNFFEAHQQRLLQYHAAGNIISLTFPCETLEEYARVVTARSN